MIEERKKGGGLMFVVVDVSHPLINCGWGGWGGNGRGSGRGRAKSADLEPAESGRPTCEKACGIARDMAAEIDTEKDMYIPAAILTDVLLSLIMLVVVMMLLLLLLLLDTGTAVLFFFTRDTDLFLAVVLLFARRNDDFSGGGGVRRVLTFPSGFWL